MKLTGLNLLVFKYNDQAVQCTWEGDNTILSLQAGRSLVAAYADALKNKTQPGGTAYLNDLPAVLTSKCGTANPVSLDSIDQAWACIAANVVKKAHDAYEGFLKQGKAKEEALELCSQERFVAAKVHTAGYLFRQFRLALAELAKTEDPSNGVVATLEKVCILYGGWTVEENAQYFLQYAFYTPHQVDVLSKEVTALCAELRTCAVSLVDSFNFSDHIVSRVSSAVGGAGEVARAVADFALGRRSIRHSGSTLGTCTRRTLTGCGPRTRTRRCTLTLTG